MGDYRIYYNYFMSEWKASRPIYMIFVIIEGKASNSSNVSNDSKKLEILKITCLNEFLNSRIYLYLCSLSNFIRHSSNLFILIKLRVFLSIKALLL